jgi:hypothetical protein
MAATPLTFSRLPCSRRPTVACLSHARAAADWGPRLRVPRAAGPPGSATRPDPSLSFTFSFPEHPSTPPFFHHCRST